MHPCAELLQEIVTLCHQESQALDREDIARVSDLAGKRSALLNKVWRTRAGYPEDLLRSSLLDIQKKQQGLKAAALALQETLRKRQRSGLKQTKYFNQDRYIRGQLRRSFYFDKTF